MQIPGFTSVTQSLEQISHRTNYLLIQLHVAYVQRNFRGAPLTLNDFYTSITLVRPKAECAFVICRPH